VPTQRLQLLPEAVDVALSGDSRMGASLQCVLLRWKPKGVPADGVQDIVSLMLDTGASGHHLCIFMPADLVCLSMLQITCMRLSLARMSVAVYPAAQRTFYSYTLSS
jgi:hypothetical protein